MAKTTPLISIILPTYNEIDNIVLLIRRLSQILKNNYEIIVVDDDSPDGTAKIVKKNFKSDPKIKLFVKKENKGLAKAIRFGLEKSLGKYLIVMDTDFNHNPTDLPRLLAFKDKFDLTVGSRYIKGGGMEDRRRFFLSYFYNLLIKILLGLKTHDNLSGFFLVKKEILQKFDYDKIFFGYGDYFIRFLFYAHHKNLKIQEIPVFYQNRLAGESKSKFFSLFVNYSKTVLEILSHP